MTPTQDSITASASASCLQLCLQLCLHSSHTGGSIFPKWTSITLFLAGDSLGFLNTLKIKHRPPTKSVQLGQPPTYLILSFPLLLFSHHGCPDDLLLVPKTHCSLLVFAGASSKTFSNCVYAGYAWVGSQPERLCNCSCGCVVKNTVSNALCLSNYFKPTFSSSRKIFIASCT